eukprot:gene25105-biopygen15002
MYRVNTGAVPRRATAWHGAARRGAAQVVKQPPGQEGLPNELGDVHHPRPTARPHARSQHSARRRSAGAGALQACHPRAQTGPPAVAIAEIYAFVGFPGRGWDGASVDLAICPWCTVYGYGGGVWCMVDGVWCMVYGCMVYGGVWCVVWCVVLWCMVRQRRGLCARPTPDPARARFFVFYRSARIRPASISQRTLFVHECAAFLLEKRSLKRGDVCWKATFVQRANDALGFPITPRFERSAGRDQKNVSSCMVHPLRRASDKKIVPPSAPAVQRATTRERVAATPATGTNRKALSLKLRRTGPPTFKG